MKKYRLEIENKNYIAADSLMAKNPRRWWENRTGDGNPWTIGKGQQGPWAKWDDHFRTRQEIIKWKEQYREVTLTTRETNDYFQLLERGWVTNEITYYFNEEVKIQGLLIKAVGDRPPGRTDEFLAWARMHYPEEIEVLMPGGEIDPLGDHPQRFRNLLNKWRLSIGLSPVKLE